MVASKRLLRPRRTYPLVHSCLAGTVGRPTFVHVARGPRADQDQVAFRPGPLGGLEEGVAQDLGSCAVEQHVALVGLASHFAGEADGSEGSGTVDEDDALAGVIVQLLHQEVAEDVPGFRIGQVCRDVVELIGPAATDVVDLGILERNRASHGEADSAGSARDEDQIPVHGRTLAWGCARPDSQACPYSARPRSTRRS